MSSAIRLTWGMQLIVASVCLALGFTELSDTAQAQDVATPVRPTQQLRTYQLPNGIRALSIQQESAPRSAFFAAVNVGSASDPIEVQGLAYILEHLLPLGTKSHPGMSEFEDFMQESGGRYEGSTARDYTLFRATLRDVALPETLRRAAELFSEPVLSERKEGRIFGLEGKEDWGHSFSDILRADVLLDSLFPFPLNALRTGSHDTLITIPKALGVDLFDRLRDHHRKFYCGENMAVMTLSPRSLEEQEALVRAAFGNISPDNDGFCQSWRGTVAELPVPDFALISKNDLLQSFFPICDSLEGPGGAELQVWGLSEDSRGSGRQAGSRKDVFRGIAALSNETATYRKEVLGYWDLSPARTFFGVGRWPLIARTKSLNSPSIILTWMLPSVASRYREKPFEYILYMLRRSGPRSLRKKLMRLQWVENLSVSTLNAGFLYETLQLVLKPTPKGINEMDSVLQAVFAYLNDLRHIGVDSEVLRSLVLRKKIGYEASRPPLDLERNARSLASLLLRIDDPKDYVRQYRLITRPSAASIQEYLDLLTPDRVTVVIASADWAAPKLITEKALLARSCVRLTTDDGRPLIYRSHPSFPLPYTLELMDKPLRDGLVTASQTDVAKQLKRGLRFVPLPATSLSHQAPPVRKSSPGSAPANVLDRPWLTVWWRGSGLYTSPRATVSIALRHPESTMRLDCITGRHVVGALVNDLLSTLLGDYAEAGYHAHAHYQTDGYEIKVRGFRSKNVFREILVTAARALRHVTLEGTSETRLDRVKRGTPHPLFARSPATSPGLTAFSQASAILLESGPCFKPWSSVLRTHPTYASAATFAEFTRSNLARVYITSLATGLSRQETLQLNVAFVKSLGFKKLPKGLAIKDRSVGVGKFVQLYARSESESNPRNAVFLLLRGKAGITIEESVRLRMLEYVIHSRLALDRRPGDIKLAVPLALPHADSIGIMVESANATALQLASQLRASLTQIREDCANFSESDVRVWRDSLKADPLISLKTPYVEHLNLWGEVVSDRLCFARRELQTQYLEDDSYWKSRDKLLETFDNLLDEGSRLEVLVQADVAEAWDSIYRAIKSLKGEKQTRTAHVAVNEFSPATVEAFKKQLTHMTPVDTCALTEGK